MTNTFRTAKQHAHARRIAQRTFTQTTGPKIVLPSKGSGAPPSSWWINQTREDFSATAKAQRERLVNSRFAQVSDPTYHGGE